MRMFDVRGVEIMAPCHKVFEFLREPGNLPRWAHAFVSAGDGRARLETPAGAVDIALDVLADAETGTVVCVNAERRGSFANRKERSRC